MPAYEAIGIIEDGHLTQWLVHECRQWELKSGDAMFGCRGQYALWPAISQLVGDLATPVPQRVAAALLLGSGYELPQELVRLLQDQHHNDNPKTQKRSKPRKPFRRPPGQYGLAGFADSQRTRTHEL